MIFAFMFGESWKGEYYNNWDLENGIQYCQEYLNEGYIKEYMDKFDLKEFIEWAKMELSK